ncbi:MULTISPECIES: hypothetical protein [Piscinibacter]|uniref:hypothetical protein n=1 Tax=Piscinibacter TaxID=1114981 RepID=UPI000FDEC6CD|nr:hypothetical protein [Piscinibacter defluvii]
MSESPVRAPRWAVPALASYLVARSDRHYLRRLDAAAFADIAKACDRFLIWTTTALFALAATLIPWGAGAVMLIVASVWGMVVLLAVGRPVGLERRRRRRLVS